MRRANNRLSPMPICLSWCAVGALLRIER